MVLERFQLNLIRPRLRGATTILLVLAGFGMAAHAQSCPIEIESVTRQTLTSGMGNYGTALQISFRNISKFPVRSIEFGIEVVSAENPKAKPEAIISYHPLLPDTADALVWNSTHFDKENHGSKNFVVWPAVLGMADGSKWVGKSSECYYSSDAAGKDRPVATEQKSATRAPSEDTMKRLQSLIDNKQASVVDVTSDPPGAAVDVDMKLIGKTPLRFVLIKNPNGASRNVMIYMNGYALKERDVTPNGETITMNERLIPLTNAH
jgi:PEGA domain